MRNPKRSKPETTTSTSTTTFPNSRPTSATGGLPFAEFHRIYNSISDVLDPHFGTGHFYSPEEIERNCRAREIFAREISRLVGVRDSKRREQLAAASRFKANILPFESDIEDPRWLRVPDVVRKYAGVTASQVRAWIYSNADNFNVRCVSRRAGRVFIDAEELERWMGEGRRS